MDRGGGTSGRRQWAVRGKYQYRGELCHHFVLFYVEYQAAMIVESQYGVGEYFTRQVRRTWRQCIHRT